MTGPNITRTSKSRRGGDRFVRISNSALQDKRLSFRARGVLAYVLSMPDDWAHSADTLSGPAAVEGRDAIKAALAELKALGYCRLVKERGEHGHFHSRLVFSETPASSEPASTDSGFPVAGREAGNQSLEIRQPVNQSLVYREPVNQSSLKLPCQNDCSETTIEKLPVEREGGDSGSPALDLDCISVEGDPASLSSMIAPHVEGIAKRRRMRAEGVLAAFEDWIRRKAAYLKKDGVTMANAHVYFESWLTTSREGKDWVTKSTNYDFWDDAAARHGQGSSNTRSFAMQQDYSGVLEKP